uniref:Uncharacterized protein n=1 Tax=Globisporangium ultimum (strain ATCC 200006 / CBS 805.95 / DAOM BR144) TaxID=431595 RepID=K3W6Q9_GLOUD
MTATRLHDAAPNAAISSTNRSSGASPKKQNVLDYSNAYFGDDKCTEIVEAARRAPFPTALDLRGNRFEATGAKRLAELLRMQHNVVSISLEWNNVGVLNEGIEAIAAALEVDTRLVTLDLRNNNISAEGAKALAHALARNRTLKQLDLRWNDIGNAGVLAFREALQSNHSLLNLELMGNNSSLKHADEIEKLLVRNRTFQEQQQQPPSMETMQEVPKTVAVETKQDDQLLLQILAEKENLESELSLARKEIHKMKETLEENDMHLKMLRKEAETLKEDRNRYQQREIDAKRETHELKMQFEELESKRKIEFEEYRAARTALERDISIMRDKMSHSEAMQNKALEQKNKHIAQLEDQKYIQDSEMHKLSLTTRSLEENVERLSKQLQDAQKDFSKKEDAWITSQQSTLATVHRQHELEAQSLESQLNHANRQLEDSQRTAATLKEKAETLQAMSLQAKIAHEKEISVLKAQWEIELQERIQRAVGSIEAQVEDVKQGRLHLEREVEKHMDTILRLRQENLVIQKASDEKHANLHQELEKQYKELQEKQDLCAAVTKDKTRCEEKLQAHLRKLEEQDARLARMKEGYDERIQEMTKTAEAHRQEMEAALNAKVSTIATLETQILRLERELSAQNHEHEKRIDDFAESFSAFLQEQVAKERERRTREKTQGKS